MDHQKTVLPDGKELLLIHFLVDGKIACQPQLPQKQMRLKDGVVWQRSDDVRGVSCPLCKGTVVFQDAQTVLQLALRSRKAAV